MLILDFMSAMNATNWLFLMVLQLNILTSALVLCFEEFFIVYNRHYSMNCFSIK